MIWFPPEEKHWHGVAPTTAMTHTDILERLDGSTNDWMEQASIARFMLHNRENHDGSTNDWMEQVSEEQYQG